MDTRIQHEKNLVDLIPPKVESTKDSVNLKLNLNDWKLKLEDRTRNRMKLTIKLNKEDAEAFKNFADATKPEDISLEDFVRAMFLTGIETYNARLAQKAREYLEAHKDEFAKQGITPENAVIQPTELPPSVEVFKNA